MKKKKWIITFSRRTDPAFFMDWFMEHVEEGGCQVPNPFSGLPYFVSLKLDDVHLINFWTKDPASITEYIDRLKGMGYTLAFFITQTNYPGYVEKSVPLFEKTREAVFDLSEKLTRFALWWRYDPIIITKKMQPEWHVENFARLCEEIWRGKTERVITSLAHIDGSYRTIRPQLAAACRAAGDRLEMPDYGSFLGLAVRLRDIARKNGMALEVCCSPGLRENDTSQLIQAQCLSLEYLRKVLPAVPDLKPKKLRKGSETYGYSACRCVESKDIGRNRTCGFGCVYCYANRGR